MYETMIDIIEKTDLDCHVINMDVSDLREKETISLPSLEKCVEETQRDFDYPVTSGEDGALLMHTSGTNGQPKGVLFANEQVVRAVTEISCCLERSFGIQEFGSGDAVLTYLPLAHCFQLGMGISVMAAGGCLDFASPFTLTSASPW